MVYARLGWHETGPDFDEAGIPHVKMEKELTPVSGAPQVTPFRPMRRNGTILDLASLNGIAGLRDLLKKHNLTGVVKRFHPTTPPETIDAGIAALL